MMDSKRCKSESTRLTHLIDEADHLVVSHTSLARKLCITFAHLIYMRDWPFGHGYVSVLTSVMLQRVVLQLDCIIRHFLVSQQAVSCSPRWCLWNRAVSCHHCRIHGEWHFAHLGRNRSMSRWISD